MSHEIDFSNDRANIAYVGDTPWHGFGHKLPDNADIDQWRVAAGLDWSIEQRAVFYGKMVGDSRIPQPIEGRKALVRSDTQECLSIMSDRYKPVQPGEILEFYRELVEGSRFTMETAGSLRSGAKIWALARGNIDLRVMGQDVIKPYLLLATSCDGTMSTVADFTSVRVVCNNTLTMAVGSNGQDAGIRVRHNTAFNADAVKQELGLIDSRLDQFGSDIEVMAGRRVSQAEAIKYFIGLYAKTDRSTGEVENEKSLEKITSRLMALYTSGPGANLRSAEGTAWGLVNAVTHYEDFIARARNSENRFSSAQFGRGASVKSKAVDAALAMAA